MPIQKLKYATKEKYKEKGAKWFLLRGGLILLAIWLVWPQSDMVQSSDALIAAEKSGEISIKDLALGKGSLGWKQIEVGKRDLRKIMTSTQSQFYRESFQWMMEYGEADNPRPFGGKNLTVVFQATKPFENEDKLTCRYYSEKLIISEQADARKGIACQRGKDDWCRQPQNEKAECPQKEVKGMKGLKLQKDLTLQQWNRTIDQKLNQLPSF